MSGVWVISETPQTAWELLGKARELAGGDAVTAFVVGDDAVGQETIAYGADQVRLMDLPVSTPWEEYAGVMGREAETARPAAVLVGASRRGKDLAARLAALLDAAYVSECKSIRSEDGKYITERIVYGGLAVKKMESTGCLVASIAPRTYEPKKDGERTGIVAKLDPAGAKVKVKERRPKPAESVNISEASIVIGVGRGFSSQAEVKLAENLAAVLGGEIGCTRPIAEDLHWLPEDRYIGLSGQVVKPILYICAGVSGQVQHVYGIRDAKTIVAVEKNESAPILQVADYYIIGDLKEVLPALTEAISAVK
ncbi:electron transfer flavoprotein subunit alpha/FixB family protein [Candidatus Formimonas warabiya]|uniref:Electron transfer flavoprotein subunit alpha n=1 Tax=Formimonas warabiya TaxID=1761012 RepID=A0A3G1KYP3_FORW1|nr:electron transfer flavoprotein subunit alpha/FixB family protein [Candidatus Formimonas warabiya]ATW27497.1 electron transfer flavoprotein subunit alpha [Candidatus Formimonas warabiya]